MPLDLPSPTTATHASTAADVQHWCLPTPIGPVGLRWRPDPTGATGSAGALIEVQLAADTLAAQPPPAPIAAALTAYFADPDRPIALPVQLAGTPFQQRVWAAIAAIPAGSTRTYGALSAALGSAPRAIGGACRANPCPLVVPCHRVVGRHGLGGFAGDRDGRLLAIKTWLLRHERALPGA